QTHRNLGLDPFVARQGVAFRPMTPDEVTADGIVPIPTDHPYLTVTGAYVDVPRTRALLWDEVVYRGMPDQSRWPDDATRGIPTYYGYSHLALSAAAELIGDIELTQRNLVRAEDWLTLAER